jgi:hypothetical protein
MLLPPPNGNSHQLPDLSFVSPPLDKIFRRNVNARIQRLLGEALAQKYSSGTGKSSITSASRTFPNTHDADDFFNRLGAELFRVRKWNEKTTLTNFELFDEKGNISERQTAIVGDFIRLSMAGTEKSDWAKVIEIVDEAGEAILTIKPSYNPTGNEPDKKNTTSHFVASTSTNSFCLEKHNAVVSFYIIELLENVNTGETGSFIERARNVAVSKVGSYFAIEKGNWKALCVNFLRFTDQERDRGLGQIYLGARNATP